jgi:amidase
MAQALGNAEVQMIMRMLTASLLGVLVALAAPIKAWAYDVQEKTIAQLQQDLAAGAVTSEQLVEAYLERIAAIDDAGPTLNAVIAINPDALASARALDAERRAGRTRGPLHGTPILLKDNIESADAMATTAGSLALQANRTERDAPVVARLRAAGAIILGKTNLSEWANIRDGASVSGWSAIGGLTRNPYALNRNACGSSSGSGAGAAASLAAAAIGTETDGSVVCPSSVNGLVGLKPTVGLVSRTHIIPISQTQDTAGPMARSVADAALLLTVMAGSDSADPATAEADRRRRDYTSGLTAGALAGRRIGVLRFMSGFHAGVDVAFSQALEQLKAAGATLVDIPTAPVDLATLGADELTILLAELKSGLSAYLATTPGPVQTRSLAEVIAFNAATPRETALFGQSLFERAQATQGTEDPAYRLALSRAPVRAAEILDGLMRDNSVDALAAPTTGPAWLSDVVLGDHYVGGGASMLPAIAGYPHVTVPMGLTGGLPVGLSLIAGRWEDDKLLAFAYAFEQQAQARRPPRYETGVETTAPFATAVRGDGAR